MFSGILKLAWASVELRLVGGVGHFKTVGIFENNLNKCFQVATETWPLNNIFENL